MIKDRIAEIIEAGIECGKSPHEIAEKILLYIQQSLVFAFCPGQWRGKLGGKNTAEKIMDALNGEDTKL